VIGFRTIGIAEILAPLLRLETAPAPLALPRLIFPGIGAACFVADNVIDNQDFAGVTGYGSIFRHRIHVVSF